MTTTITRAYAFVIFDTDEATPDLSFTEADFVGDPPTWGAWRVNPLKGTSESEPFTVSIIDTGEQVTSNMSDATGRADLIGRLWRLQINEDGAGLATVAQGRIVGATDHVTHWDFACGDERFLTRQRTVYTGPATPTTQIWPPGFRSKWLDFEAEPVATVIVHTSDTYDIKVELDIAHGPKIPKGVEDWIQSDRNPDAIAGSTSSSSGHYTYLRANVDGTDREVLGFGPILDSQLGARRVKEGIWIALPSGHGISAGDLVKLYLHAPGDGTTGAPPSEVLPYHIGGEFGVNLWSELKDRYDDEGIRYDTNAFGTWDASTNPGGLIDNPIIHDGHLRLTHQPTLGELEDMLCKEYGLALFPNASGEITPRSIFLPFGVDPTTLTQVTSAKFTAPHPTFHQIGAEARTVLQVSYREARLLTAKELESSTDHPGDGISVAKVDLAEVTHDRVADLGRHVHKLDLQTVFRRGFAKNRRFLYKRELFDRFGDGPIRGVFTGLSSLDGILPGDNVVLDLSSYPDLATQTRGGKRVVQVLERRMTPTGGEFEYLDNGADDNALAAPGVAIIKNVTRPKHAVDVTISSLPAAADGYTLQLKLGSRNWETRGDGTANETVTFENLPSGTTIQAHARSFASQAVRSDWSAAVSVALTALTAPSSAAATATNRAIALTWTNGEATYPIMPTLDGTDYLAVPLPAGSTRFVFTELAASTLFTCGVKHVDPFGGASALDTDTATTGTAGTLTDPTGLQVTQEAPVSDLVHPTENRYGTGVEISVTRTEPHAYLEVQTSTDSFVSVETRRLIEGAGDIRIDLPLDNTERDIRVRHVKPGSTASGWTAVATGTPLPFSLAAASGIGTVSVVTVGTGLDVTTGSTTPDITLSLDELPEHTGDLVGTDRMVVVDATLNTQYAETISGVPLSIFKQELGTVTAGVWSGTALVASKVPAHDDLTGFVAGEHFLQSAITEVGTIATGVWEGTDIGSDHGGTGLSNAAYGVGSILYSVDGSSLSALAAGSDGEVLTLASGVPSWASGAGSGDLTEVTVGTGLDVSSGTGPVPDITLSLDELPEHTGDLVGTDRMVVVDATPNAQYAETISGVPLSIFKQELGTVTAGVWSGTALVAAKVPAHDDLTGFVAGEHFLQSAITTVGTITTGVWQGTDVGSDHGGTGLSNAAIDTGGILHSIDGTSWASLAPGSEGQVLTIVSGIPAYAAGATVTEVTVGTGLDVATGTTTPDITLSLDELPEHTGDLTGTDRLVMVDATLNAQYAETISGIPLSIFKQELGTVTAGVWSGTALVAGKVPNHDALNGFVAGEHFLQSAITTVGTVTTGVWEGTDVGSDHGGTGLSNAGIDTGGILHSIDGTSWASLAPGTEGQVLKIVSGIPAYASGGSGTITEVVAGAGMTGGGTSGSVTLNVIGTAGTIDVTADAVDFVSIIDHDPDGVTRDGFAPAQSVILRKSSDSTSSDTGAGGTFKLAELVYAHQTVATTGSLQGFEAYVVTQHSSGTVALAIANIGNVENTGAGDVTDMRAFQGGVVNSGSGTITLGSAFQAAPPVETAGAITIAVAFHAPDMGSVAGTSWALYAEANECYFGARTQHQSYCDLLEQGSAPGTPASGYIRLYALNDGKLYQKDDTGTATALI